MHNIQEGPVQKNKALKDIEFVLHCLLEVSVTQDETSEYFIKPPHTFTIDFKKNSLDQMIASCPNGKIYNLSCALRYANFSYFTLSEEMQTQFIKIFTPEKLATLLELDELPTPIDNHDKEHLTPLEKEAIWFYTTNHYKTINTLLRGQLLTQHEENEESWIGYFFIALLVISGANKNVAQENEPISTEPVHRFLDKLPIGFVSDMFLQSMPQHLAGMTSFSENLLSSPYLEEERPFKITLVNRGRNKNITEISSAPDEQEVLFGPMDVYYEKNANNPNEVMAYAVSGPSIELNDHYLSESALIFAYEHHLKHPYKDAHDKSSNGIERPNHALAHHARIMMYSDSVIEHFTEFAEDELKTFCMNLTLQDKEIIKVMLAFSKTGRESEIDFHEDEIAYKAYQKKSRENLEHFLLKQINLSEDEIKNFGEVVQYMQDPIFLEKITGNEAEKKRKAHLNDILSLSHKLDLPRCFDEIEWNHALQNYIPTENSLAMKHSFESLKLLALDTIAETGDQVMLDSPFERQIMHHYIANTNPLFCTDLCKFSKNTFREAPSKKIAIRQSYATLEYSENVEIFKNSGLNKQNKIIASLGNMKRLSEYEIAPIFDVTFIKYLFVNDRIKNEALKEILLYYTLPNLSSLSALTVIIHLTEWDKKEKETMAIAAFEYIAKNVLYEKDHFNFSAIEKSIKETKAFLGLTRKEYFEKLQDFFIHHFDLHYKNFKNWQLVIDFIAKMDWEEPYKNKLINAIFKKKKDAYLLTKNSGNAAWLYKALHLKNITTHPKGIITADDFIDIYNSILETTEKVRFFDAWINTKTFKAKRLSDLMSLIDLPECTKEHKEGLIEIIKKDSLILKNKIDFSILHYLLENDKNSDSRNIYLQSFISQTNTNDISYNKIKMLIPFVTKEFEWFFEDAILRESWGFSSYISFISESENYFLSNERVKKIMRKAINEEIERVKANDSEMFKSVITSSYALKKILLLGSWSAEHKKLFLQNIDYDELSLKTMVDVNYLLESSPSSQWTDMQQVQIILALTKNANVLLNNTDCITVLHEIYQMEKPVSNVLLDMLKNMHRYDTLQHVKPTEFNTESISSENCIRSQYIFEKIAKSGSSNTRFLNTEFRNPSFFEITKKLAQYPDGFMEQKMIHWLFGSLENCERFLKLSSEFKLD